MLIRIKSVLEVLPMLLSSRLHNFLPGILLTLEIFLSLETNNIAQT